MRQSLGAGEIALLLAGLLLVAACQEQPSPYPSRRPEPPPLPDGVQERTYWAERLGFVLLLPDTTGYIGSSRLVREAGLNEGHAAYVYGLVEEVAGTLRDEKGLTIERRILVAGAGYPFEEHLDRLRHLRVAFLQGNRDTAVDTDRNRRAARTLESAGIPVQLVEVPGAGHELARTTGLPELFDFLLDDRSSGQRR